MKKIIFTLFFEDRYLLILYHKITVICTFVAKKKLARFVSLAYKFRMKIPFPHMHGLACLLITLTGKLLSSVPFLALLQELPI